MSDVFDAFDLFEAEEGPADPVGERTRGLALETCDEPEAIPAARVLKPGRDYAADGLRGDRVYLLRRARLWVVETEAATEAEAARLGRLLQRSLLSRRALHYSDPSLHGVALAVVFPSGIVRLPPK